MSITVENKGFDGFDVRIGGIDRGQGLTGLTTREQFYKTVMDHVVARMDNYYDANGLTDIEWKFAEDSDEEIEAIIEVLWASGEKLPDDEDIVENVRRWLEEVLK